MLNAMYGFIKKQDAENCRLLLVHEINSFLRQIHETLGKKKHLSLIQIKHKDIILLKAAAGVMKAWEFKLNEKEEVKQGNVGKLVVITNGIKKNIVRKQRALIIAAEMFVYYSFANSTDKEMFNSIKNQSMTKDVLKKLSGKKTAAEIRDSAIRHVVEEIKAHPLAHHSGEGWVMKIKKIKEFNPAMADLLGSSEETFKKILLKQSQKFSPEMLKQEEVLVKREIEEIKHLIELLRLKQQKEQQKQVKFETHIKKLRLFQYQLETILSNIDNWLFADKQEHEVIKMMKDIPFHHQQEMVKAEAEASEVDMNKIYLVFQHFQNEKLNILRELNSF